MVAYRDTFTEAQVRRRAQLLQTHYATCEDFAEETLDKVRNELAQHMVVDHDFWGKYIAVADPCTDPSAFLDNEIHPILAEDNWTQPSNIPMASVRAQLKPALQLASHPITDERTLQWFAHVRYANRVTLKDGPVILVDTEAISQEMLSTVKKELLTLSHLVKFAWFGSPDTDTDKGVACNCLAGLTKILGLDKPEDFDKVDLKSEDFMWFPTVIVRVSELHTALQQRHRGATFAAQRVSQFMLATILVHELSHV